MTRAESRFTPQHRFWEEDLPARMASSGGGLEFLDELLSVGITELQVSRRSDVMRGGFLVLALVIAGLSSLMLPFLLGAFIKELSAEYGSPWTFGFLLAFWLSAFGPLLVLAVRFDLRMPRDTPIRFNRQTGKVQAYEHNWSCNPFTQWPTVIKEFDWSTVEAEIHKQAGFNGKAYVVRYALVLCICKPGTNEVVDRVTLKANRIVTQDLHALWNYLRVYMRDGPEKLPPVKLLPSGASFRRSFFEYMPWFDPTADGRELRAKMSGWLLVFNSIVTVLVFWLVIPMGICHYIALKLAPQPKWPDEAAG
jgi:hypothetical protein